ncbi:glutaredoxin-4, partial [Salmonella enterica subsp. enterica serovar Heidelberg str. CFSAN002075]
VLPMLISCKTRIFALNYRNTPTGRHSHNWVGGCDIVIEMYQRGELQQLIKETAAKYKTQEPDAE